MLKYLFNNTHCINAFQPAQQEQQADRNLSLPFSLINTWKSVVASSLEAWLTSAVYTEASLSWLRWRVCGSPMGTAVPGKPCQVQVAWTKPYTTNGKCFCRAANLTRAVTATSLLCCQCRQRDCVLCGTCPFKQALWRKKKILS